MFDVIFYVLTLICLCFSLICIRVLLRQTPFQLGGDFKYIWSLLFYKEMILIVTPVLLLIFFEISDFNSFFVTKQEDVARISFYISFFLLLLFLFLSFFYRLLISNLKISLFPECFSQGERKHYLFAFSFILSGLFILIFSILFLGYKHAFFYSIFMGEPLLKVRMENVHQSHLPTQISFLITMSWWVGGIFSGFLLYKKSKLFFIVFSLCVGLATAAGDKGPIIQYIMLFIMSYLFFYRPKLNFLKLFFMSFIYGGILFFIIYQVVSVQIPDLTLENFLIYLIERLGIGQMAGAYETLSSEFFVENSWWHMIPFASFFVDYPIFSKELMLFTENYAYNKIGVKNSFFIAEAYGMGGDFLMIISPIILAFAYIVKIIIVFTILKLLFGLNIAKIYSMPIIFLSSSLTGDFSSFVFQKSVILIAMTLFFIYFIKVFLELILRIKRLL